MKGDYNMCEKNFEGKQLSLLPEDDIEEETIINDEIKEETIKPKKRSTKKVTEKICKTCGEDIISNENRNVYRYMDVYAQLQAKEYCKDHEAKYSDHKCKPHWCGDCGFLTKYEITINFKKK
tara:strand:- start:644 stop:1009 length:366 start_codon:yes stop_codon:yes gene_type:complete